MPSDAHKRISAPSNTIPFNYRDSAPSPAEMAEAALDGEPEEILLTFHQAGQLLQRSLEWILKGETYAVRNMRLEIVAYILNPSAPNAKNFSTIARENNVAPSRITELARNFEAYYGVILHRDNNCQIKEITSAGNNIVPFKNTIIPEANAKQRQSTLTDDLVRDIRAAVSKGHCTRRKIIEILQHKSPRPISTIKDALIRAMKHGILIKISHGVYALPTELNEAA